MVKIDKKYMYKLGKSIMLNKIGKKVCCKYKQNQSIVFVNFYNCVFISKLLQKILK